MIRALSWILGAGALCGLPWLQTQEPEARPAPQPCCAPQAAAVSLASAPAAAVAVPHLDQIKKLVGSWYACDENGQPTAECVASLRVTAGGHAVVETLFPGTEHEMLSVYFMDGGDLMMTHYCVLGNAPRYRAEATANGLVWRCQGAHNLKAHSEAHMHEGRTEFLGPNRMRGAWDQTVHGEVTMTAAFDLVRITSA